MDMLLGLVGFLAMVFGLVNVIYPLKATGIKTRAAGFAVLASGFVLLMVGVYMAPDKSTIAKPVPAATQTAQPAVVPVPAAGRPDAQQPAEAKASPTTPVVAYEVHRQEDISFSTAKRLRASLVVKPESTKAEIELAVKAFVEKTSQTTPLNAIAVFVYDRPGDVGQSGFTLARAEWAPGGIWGNAINVKAGDYKTHAFSWQFMKKVTDPDKAPPRPTDEEFAVWDDLWKLIKANPDKKDAELKVLLSQQRNISMEEIDRITHKAFAWLYY